MRIPNNFCNFAAAIINIQSIYIMNIQEVAKQCIAKREELINLHLEHLPQEEAIDIDHVCEIMHRLEAEYKHFLSDLWDKLKGADDRTIDDILDKHYHRYGLGLEYSIPIITAHAKAEEITLWEQITNSNYRDVAHLNVLIRAYATDLLAHITADFMEDL